MGCECFGPRRSRSQVFIKLIKSIHQDTRKITAQQSLKFQQKGTDLFKLIYERINKKGDLRKLIDNLSSRKHRVQDSLIFNYGQLSQTKQLKNLYTGLIITDSITEAMYPRLIIQQKQIQSQMSSSFTIELKKQSFTQYTQKSDKKFKQKSNFPISNETNLGTDEQYFKTIIYLFGIDKRLKLKVLESINNFCQRHLGIFACDAYVWKLIQLLVIDISNNQNKQKCCQAFKNLLMRTRDKITQFMKNRFYLQTLIFLWLDEHESLDQSSIKDNAYQMLYIYFNRFISAWESQFLFQSLFHAFDKIQFNKITQPQIQRLYQEIIQTSMLRINFLRSLFNYLIGYLLILPHNTCTKKQLMITLGLKIENIKVIYKNAMKNKVKVEGFRRLNAWIDKKYSNIDQFCLYNGVCLIYAFADNLVYFSDEEQTLQLILIQFDKLYKKLNKQEKHRLIQRAIQQFQRSSLSPGERKNIQILIKKMISNQQIKKSEFNQMNFFAPIQTNFTHLRNVQIINLNTFLLQSVQISQIDQLGKTRLSQFLYSLHQNIVSDQRNFNQKYEILIKTICFLGIAIQKISKGCLKAYLCNIYTNYLQKSKNFSISSQFCVLYLAFKLKQLLQDNPIPIKLQNIKNNLDNLNNKDDCMPQINKYFFAKDELQVLQKDVQGDQQQYIKFKSLFLKLFNTKNVQKIESFQKRSLFFSRNNSMPGSQQALSLQSQDKSFGQAIEILLSK